MTGKMPNHDLSEMKCPVNLEDVDLFGPGAQEHWYEAYDNDINLIVPLVICLSHCLFSPSSCVRPFC